MIRYPSDDADSPADAFARPFVHVLAGELEIIEQIRRRKSRAGESSVKQDLPEQFPASSVAAEEPPGRNGDYAAQTQSSMPRADEPSTEKSTEKERKEVGAIELAHHRQLVGLCFSGGGIRSATFNLGVLQGLAQLKLLGRFDYLSTVSGGGYIGGWLISWILRSLRAAPERQNGESGIAEVTRRLHPDRLEHSGFVGHGGNGRSSTEQEAAEGSPGEPMELRFLREYSNYLTPKIGWFGADTWTMVTIYIRNLVLNLLVLFTSLSVLILVTNFFGLILSAFANPEAGPLRHRILWWQFAVPLEPHWYFVALAGAIVAVLVSSLMIGTNLGIFARNGYHEKGFPSYTQQGSMQRFVVLPLFVAAFLCSCLFWHTSIDYPAMFWVSAGAVVHTIMSGVAWLASGRAILWYLDKPGAPPGSRSDASQMPWVTALLVTPVAGAIGGMLVFAVAATISNWGEWQVVTWGPPLFVAAFTLMMILHIGLVGRRMPDNIREWWSRLLAWLLIYSVGWAVLFSFPTYGPPALLWLAANNEAVLALVTSLWGGLTAAGVLAGRKAAPETRKGKNGALEMVAKIAPYVFIVGLLAGLSLAVHSLLFYIYRIAPIASLDARLGTILHGYWDRLHLLGWDIWIPSVVILGIALLLGWRIDVNQFSMHLFYRNRLVRCFLGASNRGRRGPQPFTGFDPQDDIPLSDITGQNQEKGRGEKTKAQARSADASAHYDGPYPIINAALNLVGGEELAWQQRKATSFIFTPGFTGYMVSDRERAQCEDSDEQQGSDTPLWLDRVASRWAKLRRKDGPAERLLERSGYRQTRWYAYTQPHVLGRRIHENIDGGGISLGTAMAISGAAASPNMGYHSSAPLAFLMTIFNIRLGWWIGNPRHSRGWQSSGPRMLSSHLLVELFGLTNDEHSHVYLSDGGHFENLGLYELVRRRCRLIVASDAGQDGLFQFNDLGNAIEKCRADLGIDIEIRVEPIRHRDEHGYSQWHCAVGTIRYDRVDAGGHVGTLLYLKSSITGDEPTDVLRYTAQNEEFPHQSTADQWFNESQFESYRMLGLHSILEAFKGVAHNDQFAGMSTESIALNLHQRWLSPSRRSHSSILHHTKTLEEIHERLRQDPRLHFLDAQIYPAWGNLNAGTGDPSFSRPNLALPKDPETIRHGFYICSQIIQLMEDVYLDLNLDEQFDHPDNRGWVNLFRHWSWSGMFRATWAVTASTYGARFQRFCERRFHLRMGDISIGEKIDLGGAWSSDAHHLLQLACEEGRLNAREKSIIEAFWTRRSIDSVLPLLITLDVGLVEPGGQMMNPHATSSIRFPVGFVLIHAENIVYFRIQDHLRGMGLARLALQKIQENPEGSEPRFGYDFQRFTYKGKQLPSTRNEQRFARIFRSVSHDQVAAARLEEKSKSDAG